MNNSINSLADLISHDVEDMIFNKFLNIFNKSKMSQINNYYNVKTKQTQMLFNYYYFFNYYLPKSIKKGKYLNILMIAARYGNIDVFGYIYTNFDVKIDMDEYSIQWLKNRFDIIMYLRYNMSVYLFDKIISQYYISKDILSSAGIVNNMALLYMENFIRCSINYRNLKNVIYLMNIYLINIHENTDINVATYLFEISLTSYNINDIKYVYSLFKDQIQKTHKIYKFINTLRIVTNANMKIGKKHTMKNLYMWLIHIFNI